MNAISESILRAVYEGKWLAIEYKNKDDHITKYWIGICGIDPIKRILCVDGLHTGILSVENFSIYIDSILSARLLDGTYQPINKELIDDIEFNTEKYSFLFTNSLNLKILNYLELCNKLDSSPYYTDFSLVHFLDREIVAGEYYLLNDEQFREIVSAFNTHKNSTSYKIKNIVMNVLSLHTKKGLYVLAYKRLNLDPKTRILKPDEEITFCTEFTIDGSKQSINSYIPESDQWLLEEYDSNQERIKDIIQSNNRWNKPKIDDMPYIMCIGRDYTLDLHSEYEGILDMYDNNCVTEPIRAFFGEFVKKNNKRKSYPITLISSQTNLDQLLAIDNAMKYPLAYIQGPPGTGKTSTIINTLVTAFFNERTVLMSSYNNIPLDSVFNKLSSLKMKDKIIPLPVLRLGNEEHVDSAIEYIKHVIEQTKSINVYEKTLDNRKDKRADAAKRLSAYLTKYENKLDYSERLDTIDTILKYQNDTEEFNLNLLNFKNDLNHKQKQKIEKELCKLGEFDDISALEFVDHNYEELAVYLYYTSAKYIKKLDQPKYKELREIINYDDRKQRIKAFNEYISKTENVELLLKVFPIIITTCISAHRLGTPQPIFDMCIMDEASQCNMATSLVPIIRAHNLMLVGDPQQLNPVILLDENTNKKLMNKYKIGDEYNYRTQSIYKAFLSNDAVSDEVLLRNHYRCAAEIIGFNNKKYYNSKLNVCTKNSSEEPLKIIDIENSSGCDIKNTSPDEVDAIVAYARQNSDKSIGVITPFVNQKNMIENALKDEGIDSVSVGTVHAFQGDEKDVIIFSTAITSKTQDSTYEWLKNNKELINVATSRAKDQFIMLTSSKDCNRLHTEGEDDFYELFQYVKSNGKYAVSSKKSYSRALGVKPYDTVTETAFLLSLTTALENISLQQAKYSIKEEVGISQVFKNNISGQNLFYTGRFDFVIYEKRGNMDFPILAIELDGKEHQDNEYVKERDRKKDKICKEHNLELIRVENSYARRYSHIKNILLKYFSSEH